MLSNYLKVTLRNLSRSKINSLINILGLAVGIACAILIVFFVKDELTFDQFHSNIDRLYRVTTTIAREGDGEPGGMTPFVVGLTVKDEIQDIEGAVVHTSYGDIVKNDEIQTRETITIVGKDFFRMFDFSVLDGSTTNALDQVSNVILTRDMAIKYYGRPDVAGETIQINSAGELKDYKIAAVLENIPSNSSIQFEFLINDDNLKYLFEEQQLSHWFMIAGEVYVMLKEGTRAEDVEAKFPAMIEKGLGEERFERITYKHGLQPMADIHLGPQMASIAPVSDSRYTIILSAIAVLILIIACINFISISLAGSLNRSQEIGVRKSVGAVRGQLIGQFLMESFVLAFIALLIGLFISWLVLPLFNDLAGKALVFELSGLNLLLFVLITMLVAFLAGFYPSLVVSGFKPTKILKGEVKVGSGRQHLRMIMVGAQFLVTIFLITSTLIMRQQLNYMQNRQLGFDKDQLLMVPLNVDGSSGMRQQIVDGLEKGERLRSRLSQLPQVINASITSHSFGPGSWTRLSYRDENNEEYSFFFNSIEANYISTLDIEIIQGRDFEANSEADKRRSIIVNEAFVKEFNLENPIGQRIPNDEFDDHEIIGVVEDYNFASLHMPVEPLALALNPNIGFSGARGVDLNSDPTPKVVVNIKPGEIPELMGQLEQQYAEVYPGEPLDYHFVDERLNEQYQEEQNLGKIVTAACLLAIIIGSMGLFALAMLTMNARKKEMSIRKVLGASNFKVAAVLSKGYLILVVVALILSIPFSYYTMDKWLDDFAFRISIGTNIYLLAGMISLVIALLAISYHSIRMALNNPVDGLRQE